LDGRKPENTFRRIRSSRAETHEPPKCELLIAYTFARTVSPFLRSCPASGSASSFLPASALARHETLRSPGGQDARCVQPTSATRTNCVYPYLARSRPAVATYIAWAPHGVLGSVRYCRGKGCFTAPATASADRSETLPGSSPGLASCGHLAVIASCERGRFVPTVLGIFDRASGIPVASPSSAESGVAFAIPSLLRASSIVRKPPRPP